MQGATTINRAWDHAQRIADVFTAFDATAEALDDAKDLTWALACSLAEVPKETATSAAVRRIVATKLREAAAHPDPFAAFQGVGF